MLQGLQRGFRGFRAFEFEFQVSGCNILEGSGARGFKIRPSKSQPRQPKSFSLNFLQP